MFTGVCLGFFSLHCSMNTAFVKLFSKKERKVFR